MRTSTDREIGFVVDAGPRSGYGHAVRCLRLAGRLRGIRALFHPISDACARFLRASGAEVRDGGRFPKLVVTDLRQPDGITAEIRRAGARHVSIHDLGLAQCQSDIAIDGSIATLFPYSHPQVFLGPKYMITREPVQRSALQDNLVFVSLGGGATAEFNARVVETVKPFGLEVFATPGFSAARRCSETEIRKAIATCRFAITGAGVSLYEMLASGVPTIAVSFDCLQLRTAEAFYEHGAALSAGLFGRSLQETVRELTSNTHLSARLTRAGRALVDGLGVERVERILRRELWLTN